MGADVIRSYREWIKNKNLLDGVNNTAVVLIPKKKEADMMTNLHPISLCNVVHKVMVRFL